MLISNSPEKDFVWKLHSILTDFSDVVFHFKCFIPEQFTVKVQPASWSVKRVILTTTWLFWPTQYSPNCGPQGPRPNFTLTEASSVQGPQPRCVFHSLSNIFLSTCIWGCAIIFCACPLSTNLILLQYCSKFRNTYKSGWWQSACESSSVWHVCLNKLLVVLLVVS